jgi:signal recognition particle receptor subunit beta
MWEILSEGMIGFILLVHAGDDRSIEEASHILDTFRQYADVPYIVGVTHMDEVDASEEETFAKVRKKLDLPETVELMACDPREREHVKTLMLSILFGVMGRLELTPAATGS